MLRFDFGTSLWTGRPVIEELLGRLPLSLELAILATIVSVLLAIPLRHARGGAAGHLGRLS